MRIPSIYNTGVSLLALYAGLGGLVGSRHHVAADSRAIGSKSLATCMDNSAISASTFDVLYTPGNNSLSIHIAAISTISGYINAQITLTAYGYQVISINVDPCNLGSTIQLTGMCPISATKLDLTSNVDLPSSIADQIPSIAYNVPDIDGVAKILVFDNTNTQVACIEAFLYNGKTVYQKGVGWASAVVAGAALVVSAIMSGFGHSTTATHVAVNSLTLFGFFQSQAIAGMTSVTLPPIAAAWTQNFQWSMGVIRLGFMQKIFTWYIKSTGGTPSTFLDTNLYGNVLLQKRDAAPRINLEHAIPYTETFFDKMSNALFKRADTTSSASSVTVFRGIRRVAYTANIEVTNLFMTGYAFFIAFIFFVAIGVILFKWICEGCIKAGWMRRERFHEFRAGWKNVLKGIMYRCLLIGYTQMTVLCLWELYERDSAGAIANAVLMFLVLTVCLFYAAYRVVRLARRSQALHKNPAYILYSDPKQLNRWGFLYVQYRASAYWFVLPFLSYTLLRGIAVGLLQGVPLGMIIFLLVVELAYLAVCSYFKPLLDKRTNILIIAVAAMNFINAIILLFFANVFGLPPLGNGILGVLFFVVNAVFSLVLIIFVIVSCVLAFVRKDPDSRYAPMQDARTSYMKQQNNDTQTELDALAAGVRGDAHESFNNDKEVFHRGNHSQTNSMVPLVKTDSYANSSKGGKGGDMWKRGVGYD